jgi:hypothetical protein
MGHRFAGGHTTFDRMPRLLDSGNASSRARRQLEQVPGAGLVIPSDRRYRRAVGVWR